MNALRGRLPLTVLGAVVIALLSGCGHHSSHGNWNGSPGFHAGHGDRTIVHDDVTLSSGDEVTGNLNIVDSHVRCDGATIDGDVRTYFGDFDQGDDCTVRGSVIDAFNGSQAMVVAPWLAPAAPSRLAAEEQHVLLKCAYGIIVLVMFLLFPRRTRTALDRVEHHPGLSAMIGTLIAIATIPIAILLAISVIGIPLILLEAAAVCAMLWIGEAAVALLIGRRFYELVRPHTTPSPLGALLVGLVLITAAECLPVVGWAVTAIVTLVGLGCAIMAFIEERRFARFERPGDPPPPGADRPPGDRPAPGQIRGTPPGPSVPMRSP